MKTLFSILFLAAAIGYLSAQAQPAHEWNATVKVLDDTGQPVIGADVKVNYLTSQLVGLTDNDGKFAASHVDPSAQLAFQAAKSGYYSIWSQYELGLKYDPVKWNPTVTLVLRKIGKPIAMYAQHEETKTPKENEPIGFDLMAGDWVTPYGTGKTVDMFFTVHRNITSASKFDAELKLTFPNKGDGIVPVEPVAGVGGDFKTLRTANESGYEPTCVWHWSNTHRPEPVFGYSFRVRSVLDQNGNLKSALYGKVNGDFNFYVGTKVPRSGIGFTYYLNPTPNDRNLEFDPSQNLINNLPTMRQVKEP
jgi:hypothetical protein